MSVAVSSVKCLLVKASLCLEAAERPQWPRLYSLGRPRSSLVPGAEEERLVHTDALPVN